MHFPLVFKTVSDQADSVSVDKSLLRKTAYLVQEHTHTREISQPGFEYTLTPEALLNLTKETKPETVKVFNLLVAIRRMVQEMVTQTPYLLSIGERAEAVAEAFEQHLSSTQEALVELTKIAEEIRDAEDRRKQSDLSKEAFSALIFLEGNEVKGAEKIARDSSVVFENNPHWRESTDQERHIRLAFFKALKDSIETKKMIELVDGLLMMLRRAPG